MSEIQHDAAANGLKGSNLWRLVTTSAAVVGGPVIGSFALSNWAKKRPVMAALCLVLYESAVFFFVQVIGELWKRLKDRWLDDIAGWINDRVLEVVSRYRSKYLEHVRYECRDFDVKGLSTQGTYTLELQRVFVELSVDATPVHETSQNPIPKLPLHLQEGRHDIWEYLAVGRNLALIGAPGSGKTTLLRHIALVLASGAGRPQSASVHRLPVLLFLRNHAKEIAAGADLTLANIIESSDVVREMPERAPDAWFERQLSKGRCLVLLDGLDEVADTDTRTHLVRWLESQMKAYGKNLFIVTSRPHGYHNNPLNAVHTLVVRPFSPKQVHRFISNWYLANEIVSHNYVDLGVSKAAEKGTQT